MSARQDQPETEAHLTIWDLAPLPRFTDKTLAQALVNHGYYPSLEKAYLEVPTERLQAVHERCRQYRQRHRAPEGWAYTTLPLPPVAKK